MANVFDGIKSLVTLAVLKVAIRRGHQLLQLKD